MARDDLRLLEGDGLSSHDVRPIELSPFEWTASVLMALSEDLGGWTSVLSAPAIRVCARACLCM